MAAAPTAKILLLAAVISLGTSACMSGINREIDDAIAQERMQLHVDPLTLHAKGKPDATITPEGMFAIAGETVPTDQAQREAVQEYRTAIITYADAALELSANEAGPLARRSIRHALFGALTGTGDRADRLIDEDSARFEDKVRRLCPQLQQAWSAQQSLSSALPSFEPYANLSKKEADQCAG